MFDDSVEKFHQSSMSFGSKCIFDDCWNISAGNSINFAWKTKLNWKTNTFLIKIPQKVLGTLKMHFQQKWRNFFFKTKFFLPESEVKKKYENQSQKNQKSTSDTKNARLETLLENLARGQDNYHSKFKNFRNNQKKWYSFSKWSTGHVENSFDNSAGSFSLVVQDIFASESKLNWKKNVFEKNFLKNSPTFRMQYWQNWRNFFSELRFFRSNPRLNKTWQNTAKKIEKFFGHAECSFGNSVEKFRPKSGRLSLKVRKQFWKNLKKR